MHQAHLYCLCKRKDPCRFAFPQHKPMLDSMFYDNMANLNMLDWASSECCRRLHAGLSAMHPMGPTADGLIYAPPADGPEGPDDEPGEDDDEDQDGPELPDGPDDEPDEDDEEDEDGADGLTYAPPADGPELPDGVDDEPDYDDDDASEVESRDESSADTESLSNDSFSMCIRCVGSPCVQCGHGHRMPRVCIVCVGCEYDKDQCICGFDMDPPSAHR